MHEIKCPKCSPGLQPRELYRQKNFKGIDIEYACKAYVSPDCGLEAGTVQSAAEVQRAMAEA